MRRDCVDASGSDALVEARTFGRRTGEQATVKSRHDVTAWAVNDVARKTFRVRTEIVRYIRQFLDARGFLEVETPMMQAIPGGAAAQPFVTHHKALGCNFYLRIALELYLKRLLVGGLDRVFEIGRNFRNEGLSRKHNPEFTMLEAYQAYGDYETMMELVQSMICHVAEKVLGTLLIEHKDAEAKVIKTINLTPPWRRVKYKDIVRERAGADWFDLAPLERRAHAVELGAEIGNEHEDFEVTQAVFEKLIEPTLINPTFVTHAPKELIPLAKLSSEIDKQLAIRRHIASARIHLPMKPLPTLKLVSSRVPQGDVPPFSWPTSENDADTCLLGQQHEHPTTICKERSQILDGCGHLWSAGRVPVTDLTVDTS